MKTLFSLVIFILISNVHAADKRIGAGVGIGSVTVISAEYSKSEKTSFDGGLSFNLGNSKKLYMHASMLFHFPDSLKLMGQVYNWYYGLGGRYISFDKNKHDYAYRVGPRGSVGLDYSFDRVPIKLFAEGAFVMNLLPATNADVDVLIGGRYYF